MNKVNPLGKPEKLFRATLTFALRFKPILIVRARDAEEAKRRSLELLEGFGVKVDIPASYNRGGIIGISDPTDTEVLEICASPDGLLHLENQASGPKCDGAWHAFINFNEDPDGDISA